MSPLKNASLEKEGAFRPQHQHWQQRHKILQLQLQCLQVSIISVIEVSVRCDWNCQEQ